MAKSLASLRRVKAHKPPLFVGYGIHGVGKTTFGGEWPNPVFIQVEEGTPGGVELDSFGEIQSFADVLDAIGALLTEQHGYQTLVVDSLDAMEPLIWAQVCAENNWPSIESPGYGKGYKMLDLPWRDFLSGCKALTASGMAVVLIAHSEVTRFDSPTSDPYSRYSIKLDKRAAAFVQEEADIVGFFNYRTVLKEKDVGFKKVTHGEGSGQRLIHFEERPGFLAKNRYQMPANVEYRAGQGYAAISKYFPQPGANVAAAAE